MCRNLASATNIISFLNYIYFFFFLFCIISMTRSSVLWKKLFSLREVMGKYKIVLNVEVCKKSVLHIYFRQHFIMIVWGYMYNYLQYSLCFIRLKCSQKLPDNFPILILPDKYKIVNLPCIKLLAKGDNCYRHNSQVYISK